jgi:DNA repair photolyase
VRWNNLSLTAPESPGVVPLAIPGLSSAVPRTFDSPGFAGMTFFEIQAKSIISRVPAASRMPFEWTINPYRGCSHACVYCQVGETPILMADGRTKPLQDVRVGDRVYGTVRDGACRRFVVTAVLAHWQTIKPAFRVTLRDGTELVASADHRYLTDRGWRFVTGTMAGRERRPYLTTSNKLMGTGRFAQAPKGTADYHAGYLCGMIRGDGALGAYQYVRPSGRPWTKYGFRLALIDQEGLDRTRTYLEGFGVPVREFVFQPQRAGRQIMRAIRCQTRASFETISSLLEWPSAPSDEWHKGFLAGIFDAEGGASDCIRIANSDPEILEAIQTALRRLEFRFVVEPPRPPSSVSYVRLLGGLVERLRFFHAVDPAITRKRTIAGSAIKTAADLHVASITPLGLDLPMFDITTGTRDFIANGVVSHNCFARNTHTYLDLDAGYDFDSKVVVKVNAAQLLRRELAAPKWTGAHIAMGTNVDCYQRAEGKYGLMRGIIGALRDHANPFSILTKGTLITRDLELLRQAADVTQVGISFSVGFVDEELWRTVEPGTPSPLRRLDAVRRFADAGFPVHVLMAPILPGLTDTDGSIEATVAAIADAGAAGVSPIVLHLRPGAREWYAAWLGRNHPHLVEQYRSIYGNGSYAPKTYQREVSARVAIVARGHGLDRAHMTQHRGIEDPAASAPPAEQLTLL